MNCNFLSLNNRIHQTNKEGYGLVTDSPLQIKLIKFLGLKSYFIDSFVFKRKSSKYRIHKNHLGKNVLYMPKIAKAPQGYQLNVDIIECRNHSIPVCVFTPIVPVHKDKLMTIIYAHGNSSDMSDSVKFIEKVSKIIFAQYIVFDYSGYGQSRVSNVGQEIICQDLELVMAWSNRPLNKIILWGFSLGTYPVIVNAAKYNVKGVILQCPIASVSCLFFKELNTDVKFIEDYFANIDHIDKIKGRIFIMHSTSDEIIPFNHSKLLFDKYVERNSNQNIFFIEVANIAHNNLHKFICSSVANALQKQFTKFIFETSKMQNNSLKVVSDELKELSYLIQTVKIEDQHFNQQEYEIITDQQGDVSFSATKNKKTPKFCFCLNE